MRVNLVAPVSYTHLLIFVIHHETYIHDRTVFGCNSPSEQLLSLIHIYTVVLSQFLGICPFLGVSTKVDTELGMGAAVAFVINIATLVTFRVQKYVLDVFGLGFMQTISFILIIAALVQMVEIILKKMCIRDSLTGYYNSQSAVHPDPVQGRTYPGRPAIV